MKKTSESILKGFARIVDLTGTIDKNKLVRSDQDVLLQDWKAVGQDMEKAIAELEKEYGQKSDKKK